VTEGKGFEDRYEKEKPHSRAYTLYSSFNTKLGTTESGYGSKEQGG
jgi:hypothetical protein